MQIGLFGIVSDDRTVVMRPTKFTSCLGQPVQCCAVLCCFLVFIDRSWLILFVQCAFVLDHYWSGLYRLLKTAIIKWNNFIVTALL